jgi:predicted metal-dependent HD superfamily phosphohydrolase
VRYVAGRSGVLQKLLGRAAIYQLDRFHEKYEKQARANIAAAIEQLRWK